MNSIDNRTAQGMLAFSSCHQGASHKAKGTACQDASFARYKRGDRYAIAVVSDGHGSNRYFRSDRGSKFAVEASCEAVNEFMKCFKDNETGKMQTEQLLREPDKFMRQLETHILFLWREKVKKDFYTSGAHFTEDELKLVEGEARKNYESDSESCFFKAYGATLIVVVVYPGHFWFGIQIGDGKCVASQANGTFFQPIPWDEKCFLNVTTSLCDAKAVENFRHCFHFHSFPTAIFVASDGVDDSFANETDMYGFYQEIEDTFRGKEYKQAFREVDEFLPVLSEKGSGDDISISGIINNVGANS